MKQIKLSANIRKLTGRKVRQLRDKGIMPANIFGKSIKSLSIEMPVIEFEKAYQEAGYTNIIYLTVDKKEHPVLVSNIQTHPVTSETLHVDFHEINLKEKVTAMVGVELEGEAPAAKQGIGNLVQLLNELEVEALPTDLPEALVANISDLVEIDQAVAVKDLEYDKSKIEVQAEPDEIVVKIEELQKEEIIEQIATEGEEGAEGETPAESESSADDKPAENETAEETSKEE